MAASTDTPTPEAAPASTARRGLLAAAWAAVAALILRETTETVHAGTDGDVVLGAENFASGETGINNSTVNGIALSAECNIGTLGYGVLGSGSGIGVYGNGFSRADGGIGVGVYGIGGNPAGVVGESFVTHGVCGLAAAASQAGTYGFYHGGMNGFGMLAINASSYQGPYPGTGGWGLYATSQGGHALVGASLTPGAAGFVGSNNGIAGAYAGLYYGPVVVTGDFTVTGAKSAAVPHPDGSHRRVYCTESPESWFEDFGKGQLVCGESYVTIDSDFAAMTRLDDYHIFLTEYGVPSGLAVTEQTAHGFRVQSHDAGGGNRFSWRVVARRKDIPAPRFDPVAIPTAPEMPAITVTLPPQRPAGTPRVSRASSRGMDSPRRPGSPRS
jgi:hypothetical protein